jgi:hypothetical protein
MQEGMLCSTNRSPHAEFFISLIRKLQNSLKKEKECLRERHHKIYDMTSLGRKLSDHSSN